MMAKHRFYLFSGEVHDLKKGRSFVFRFERPDNVPVKSCREWVIHELCHTYAHDDEKVFSNDFRVEWDNDGVEIFVTFRK